MKLILDEFVNATSGIVTKEFGKDKIKNNSGGPYITGWVVTLFPYLGHDVKKMHMHQFLPEELGHCFPVFMALQPILFPFVWQYFAEDVLLRWVLRSWSRQEVSFPPTCDRLGCSGQGRGREGQYDPEESTLVKSNKPRT